MNAVSKSVGTLVFVCLLVVGCARQPAETAPPRATFGELRAQLEEHLDVCTGTVGVDPRESPDVGDYELVPNERAWLGCAYEGIERIMIPGSEVPELYRNLIAEIRALTDLVERGEVTREQRSVRIDGMM